MRGLTTAALVALATCTTLAAWAPLKTAGAQAAQPPASRTAALGAQRAELERLIRRKVLRNGLEVIVVENHGVPLATIELDVKNGAFTQTKETEGLAHVYEHMFFKANEDYPDADLFTGRAAELGAVFNGTTSEERVNYYLSVHRDSLAGAMDFLSSATMAPLFRREELEQEKQVVIGEYDRAESNPYYELTVQVGKKLWKDAWPRKNAIGEREAILAATPEIMRAIQKRYYVPNNSALIVTGDVRPEEVFALAERSFGGWRRGESPFAAEPIPPIPALTADEGVIVERPVSSVVVIMQWHGPSVGKDPQATYAADVFSDVLNQPLSTFQKRLVDTGLWQSILVNYYTLDQVGPITISGETSPEKLRDALAALEREIGRFDDPGYFTAAELEASKRKRAVGTALGLERASGFAHTIGFWWSVASLDYYMGYVDNMARQTTADLHRYAGTYIVGKPRITGVALAPEARAALKLTEGELVRRGATP
ncbi:MAG TPA: pitrilysin family protein [Gemmatimonadaceae bacterium]|nr:pitrilysin family protein [Gemmatimonadaceae bacterium]